MKRLLLLRHAQAEAAAPGSDDIDRPLSERGRAEAVDAAERIAQAGLRCDALLVSPALRTRQTATIVAAQLGIPEGLLIEPELYPGEPSALLRALRGVPENAMTVMIVGHNPGISELAAVELRTAGLCAIAFPAHTDWGSLNRELASGVTLLR